jgi:hypothetical protein
MNDSLLISSVVAFMLYGSPILAHEVTTTQKAEVQRGAEWIAFAASPNGRIFQSQWETGEEAARVKARTECERATARTCATTISVTTNFNVVALRCGSTVFFGASAEDRAYSYAEAKAARAGVKTSTCKEVFSY